MKTGLGVQERPVKMFAPRSCGLDCQCIERIEGVKVGGVDGTYVDGADEVFVADEEVGHDETKDYSTDPSANETFHCLLGRKLDELGAAESDSADVGEYVIRDHEGRGKEEPNHAFEDVVHDEMRLHIDEV